LLLYLFPLTYLAHLSEEWWVDAPISLWFVRVPRPLPALPFAVANAMGMTLMLIGVRLVSRGAAYHWMAPALALAVLLNTAGHLTGALLFRRYSAGLATAVALWVPLGLLTLMRVWDQADARTLRLGIAVGVTIELVVVSTLGWFE
jgi:hypothetical protein